MIAEFGKTLPNISLPNLSRVPTSNRLDDFLGLVNYLHDYGKIVFKTSTNV